MKFKRKFVFWGLGFCLGIGFATRVAGAEIVERCEDVRARFWNEIQEKAEVQGFNPGRLLELSRSLTLEKSAGYPHLQGLSKVLLTRLITQFNPKSSAEAREILSAIELGDRTTPQKRILQDLIHKEILSTGCEERDGGDEERKFRIASDLELQAEAKGIALVSAGGRKVMTTLYQSCSTLDVPPLDQNTPEVKGIKVTGVHSDGVGKKREISSVSEVNRTHPYFKSFSSVGGGCFNTKASPSIYDYGGKPYVTSDVNSELNFFKDAGSGTKVLGTDCSGYVFSALAATGLRIKSGTRLIARNVSGISSTMMKDPEKNGLSCLEKVPFTGASTLREGDIIAISGHVVLVDQAGEDPFGVSRISSISNCTSSQLPYSKFDFVVSQSSPSKGGVGVNRFKAADYLRESSTFRSGLSAYAVAACQSRFGKAVSKPSALSIIRHKMTEACRESAPIRLTYEGCVSGCSL